jgi:hypothetical protein
LSAFEQTGQGRPFKPIGAFHYRFGDGLKMDRSLITDVPRDKYVERCKQRAFDYLDQGALKNAVASFVGNMNARPDCELPHYLATLGVLLLMANDALGWRTLIEGVR